MSFQGEAFPFPRAAPTRLDPTGECLWDADPAVIVLDGEPVLIGHGDLYCTSDAGYQQFRAMTRDPRWRAQFLTQPLAARLAFAQQARQASQARYGELQQAGTAETVTGAKKPLAM